MDSSCPRTRTLELHLSGSAWSLGKFVDNSTQLACLEIISYQIKCGAVLWLQELQMRHGRKVWTQVRTVKSNS